MNFVPYHPNYELILNMHHEYLELSDLQIDEIKIDLELAAKAEELRGKTMRPRRKK